MEREEIISRLRMVYENAKELSTCGEPSIESRAAEVMAMSWAILWSELPFEATDTMLDHE